MGNSVNAQGNKILKWRNIIIGLTIVGIAISIPFIVRLFETEPPFELSAQERFLIGSWIAHDVGYAYIPREPGVPAHTTDPNLSKLWETAKHFHFEFDGSYSYGMMLARGLLGNTESVQNLGLGFRWLGGAAFTYELNHIQFVTCSNTSEQNDVHHVFGIPAEHAGEQDEIRILMQENSQGKWVWYSFVRATK